MYDEGKIAPAELATWKRGDEELPIKGGPVHPRRSGVLEIVCTGWVGTRGNYCSRERGGCLREEFCFRGEPPNVWIHL